MQTEIALLEIKIKLATKRAELAKLTGAEEDRNGLPGALPPAPAPTAADFHSMPPKKAAKATQAAPASTILPTYSAVDGADGKRTVMLNLANGSARSFAVGEGEDGWTVASIAPTKVVIQLGRSKVTLTYDDGSRSIGDFSNAGLNQALPPAPFSPK